VADNGTVVITYGHNPLVMYTGMDTLTAYFNSGGWLSTWGATHAFLPVDRPAAPTVTTVGATGATLYSYRITAYSYAGESLPGPAGTIASGFGALSATNYNNITWAHVSGAQYYRVYGRSSGAEQALSWAYTNSYQDKGGVASGALPTSVSGLRLITQPLVGQAIGQQEWRNSNGNAISYVDSQGYHIMPIYAGVPTAAVADGALAVDVTNNRFWVRLNGIWRWCQMN
jgi:hypothetical protein